MSGRGLLEAADLGGEGGEAISTREEMTTSRPPHTTINLSYEEKGLLTDEKKRGGWLL